MSDPAALPLPPGSSGWPLLGETLPFLRDIFGFIQARIGEGIARTHILGRPTVILAGPEACELWLDESIIQREGALPKPVRELFGGASLPSLDGETHRVRKALVMQAFTREALASYVPILDRIVEQAFARWCQQGEVSWLDEMKRLAIEGISATIFGLEPGPAMDTLLADYQLLMRGFTGVPVSLPGTDYHAALAARDRLLDQLEALAHQRQQTPGDDGVSRLLAARGPAGESLAMADLRLELHHLMLAGYIIFIEFAEAARALEAQSELRVRLQSDLERVAPQGAITHPQLARLPLLDQIVMEVKRCCRNVPISFGKARRAFEFKGFQVPEGWLVFLAVGENNHWPAVYREPERFDPARFADGRAEHLSHPHAYVPQGPGTFAQHKCAGLDFSTLFIALFVARLVRDHAWTVLPQDLRPRKDLVPPEPHDGLRAVVQRR